MSDARKKKKKRRRYRIVLPWLRKKPEPMPDGTRRTRRRKLKIRKEIWFGLAAVIAILCLIFIPRAVTDSKLKKLGYTKADITAIRQQKLTQTLIDNQWYSPYLAKSITDGTLNTDYTVYYTVVSKDRGLNATDFLLISRLKDRGYEQGQILNLYKKLKRYEITPLLVFDYQYDEQIYIDDCISHQDTNSQSNFVLSGTYYTPYENPVAVADTSAVTMLVNKTYCLDSSYIPPDLTTLSIRYAASDRQLAGVAAQALTTWCQAGQAVGVTFYAASAYRSYETQQSVYNGYLQSKGQEETDALSARPGFSEHQTGYTVDIAATNEDDTPEFKDTLAYKWTSANCEDYGWILRFPEGKQSITGYEFESWHYRYVGTDVAKAVVASGLTYDEFWCLYLKGWDNDACKPSDKILTDSSWVHLNES